VCFFTGNGIEELYAKPPNWQLAGFGGRRDLAFQPYALWLRRRSRQRQTGAVTLPPKQLVHFGQIEFRSRRAAIATSVSAGLATNLIDLGRAIVIEGVPNSLVIWISTLQAE
jgi:hypothetical protein